MLNTLFFGYLSPKWKRLARVLSLIPIPIIVLLSWDILRYWGNEFESAFINSSLYFVLVLIISYTLKPFVVKED